MDRRELLKMIAVVTGGAVIGGEFLFSGCKNPESGESLVFTEGDLAYLDEIAETILPQTTTAGAKAAGVGQHMITMVNECYTEADQKIFHSGMKKINDLCKEKYSHAFMEATPAERKELLTALDAERKGYVKKKEDFDRVQNERQREEKGRGNKEFQVQTMENHYFQQMKQLTISGYFTSEKGRKEGLRYTPVPGPFKGVIDYKKGDKLFAGLS